jgi:hypothetical protein
MLKVHTEGRGVCGIYPKDVANDEGGPGHGLFTAAPASLAVRDGGNMIAQELEVSLHMAFVEARQKRHEFITGRAPAARALRQPFGGGSAEGVRRRRSMS